MWIYVQAFDRYIISVLVYNYFCFTTPHKLAIYAHVYIIDFIFAQTYIYMF